MERKKITQDLNISTTVEIKILIKSLEQVIDMADRLKFRKVIDLDIDNKSYNLVDLYDRLTNFEKEYKRGQEDDL